MKYLADVLTGSRFLSALVTSLFILNGYWGLATVVFIFGVLTDAFDGIAARRWPHGDRENGRWYRRNAHNFDNAADCLMAFVPLLAMAYKLSYWACGVGIAVVVSGGFVGLIEVFKRLDRPKQAELVDVVFGWSYGILVFLMLVDMTQQATELWLIMTVGYGLVVVILMNFKWDRMTSRPEVEYCNPRKRRK